MKKQVPYSHIEKGTLMIASPDIQSGLFFRGVILICEHSPKGTFGILINKTLQLELPPDVLNIKDAINPNVNMRTGGPVQTNQMMLLHTSSDIPQQTLKICDNVYLGGDLQFLQQVLSDENGANIHLCFGYSGWAGGQLEREFLDGQWFSWPASKDYLFSTPSQKLWQTILRDMGGKYASLATIPDDLTLN